MNLKLLTGPGRVADLSMVSQIAEETLYPGEEKNREIFRPQEAADRLSISLNLLGKLAGQVAERNSRQSKAARTLQKIAETALEKGENPKLHDPERFGIYQGALEVLCAFDGEFESSALAQASGNLLEQGLNLRVAYNNPVDINRIKNQALMENGLEFLQMAAGSLNHHSALAIIAAGKPDKATFQALRVAGFHYQKETGGQVKTPLDLELLTGIAANAVKHPLEPVGREKTGELAATLDLLGKLAPAAEAENPQAKAEINLLGSIAQKGLQDEKCRVYEHKPHFYSKWVHEMDDWCKMGKYQGTLEVISELKPGFGNRPVQKAASRLLKAQNKFYTAGGKAGKSNQKIKSHVLSGGAEAIYRLGDALNNRRALAIMEEGAPGEGTLEELKGLKNRN